jgi:dihydrolipoamide dehydrogenase
MKEFDLVVVGAGPGGYVAAIRAAQLGMTVAVVERERAGGVCLNWGCIPSKAILHSAELYDAVKHGETHGILAPDLSFDYGRVIGASRKAADRLAKGVEFLFKKNKITLVAGNGKLISEKGAVVVEAEGKPAETLHAKHVLLATGSTEVDLPGLEPDGKTIFSSREILADKSFPKSIAIIGGGAVGLEFAYVYNAFGAEVAVVEMVDQLLPGADREVADELAGIFKKRKMKILTGTRYESGRRTPEGVTLSLRKGDESIVLTVEKVLVAVGRRPLSAGLGLEEAGVRTERGFVVVDQAYRTSAEGVLAIGDLVGGPLLAHKASAEGIACVEILAGKRERGVDLTRIPACIYCQPEVAWIGLSEAQAREKGIDVDIGRFPFRALGKAVAVGATEGFVKLVVDRRYGEVVGAAIVGRGATELIAEVGLGMTLETTIAEIGGTVHAHPTLAEALMESALAAAGESINF